MKKKNLLFILLLLIYIGLGLPDSLLSTTWPDISARIGVSIEYISVLSLVAITGSMLSSFFTSWLNTRLGVHRVIIGSMILCLLGILIFAFFQTPLALLITEIIMGLGAGAIDSNVNYIASKNLKIGQLNLLHGFWGIGVTFTPLIASIVYRLGFGSFVVFYVLAVIFIILITFAWLHKSYLKIEYVAPSETRIATSFHLKDYFGALIYFLYGVEFVIGIFLASYLTTIINESPADAAFTVSCYWGGLLISRLVAPILFKVFKPTSVLKLFAVIMVLDLFLLNSTNGNLLLIGFMIIGFCFGPVFPTFMHFTERVHPEQTSIFISKQISSMYLAIFLFQIIIGYLSSLFTMSVFITYVTLNIICLGLGIIGYITFNRQYNLDN